MLIFVWDLEFLKEWKHNKFSRPPVGKKWSLESFTWWKIDKILRNDYIMSIIMTLFSVFWGGREGYHTLLNTDVRRELDHMGSFFQMVVGKYDSRWYFEILEKKIDNIPLSKVTTQTRNLFCGKGSSCWERIWYKYC